MKRLAKNADRCGAPQAEPQQPEVEVDSDVRKALHRVLVLQGLHRDSPTYQRAIAAGRELLGLPADSSALQPAVEYPPLPSFEETSIKLDKGLHLTALERLVHDNDPADSEESAYFMATLEEALDEVRFAARAAPTQVDAGVSREYVLRAMSRNYTAGHVWDHLDADACAKGADEIKQLRAALAAQGGQEAVHAAVPFGPNNPPPLRLKGESVADYRTRCGWDKPTAARAAPTQRRDAGKADIAGLEAYCANLGRLVDELRPKAARYDYLRERDLSAIDEGGVFAGRTPENVVLNGEDLDIAIDAAITRQGEKGGAA